MEHIDASFLTLARKWRFRGHTLQSREHGYCHQFVPLGRDAVCTVADYWRLFNNIPVPGKSADWCIHVTARRPLESVSLFQDGVVPAWEDPVNANGSTLTVVWGQDWSDETTRSVWRNLTMALVGETLPFGDDVVGLRATLPFNRRKGRMEVWLRGPTTTTITRDAINRGGEEVFGPLLACASNNGELTLGGLASYTSFRDGGKEMTLKPVSTLPRKHTNNTITINPALIRPFASSPNNASGTNETAVNVSTGGTSATANPINTAFRIDSSAVKKITMISQSNIASCAVIGKPSTCTVSSDSGNSTNHGSNNAQHGNSNNASHKKDHIASSNSNTNHKSTSTTKNNGSSTNTKRDNNNKTQTKSKEEINNDTKSRCREQKHESKASTTGKRKK